MRWRSRLPMRRISDIAIHSVATPATAATTKAAFITSEIARLALMFLSVVRLSRSA